MRLKDKVAIVTGGSSGIGEAIVKLFCREGALVLVADINPPAAEWMSEFGDRVRYIYCDVVSDKSVSEMVSQCTAVFGRLDILVNNAGIDGAMSFIGDYALESFEKVVAVNLRGPFLASKHSIAEMQKQGGGSIVNIASIAGLIATPGLGIYGASKAALIQLSKSIAVEYASQNIRANAICPGMTATPMVSHLLKTNKDDADKVLAMTPMGRVGLPAEIAEAALYMASDASAYVSGTALAVDGAYTAL